MAFYYIWYDIQVGAPEMVIFYFLSFLCKSFQNTLW